MTFDELFGPQPDADVRALAEEVANDSTMSPNIRKMAQDYLNSLVV